MSTSLLYHGWGLRGYVYRSTHYCQGEICFDVEQDPDTFRCSNCGSARVQTSGQIPRRFRTLPIGGHRVNIDLPIKRLWCHACGKTRQAKIGFADERRSYTHAFERYALDLSQHMTIKAVAKFLGKSDGSSHEFLLRIHVFIVSRRPPLKKLQPRAFPPSPPAPLSRPARLRGDRAQQRPDQQQYPEHRQCHSSQPPGPVGVVQIFTVPAVKG